MTSPHYFDEDSTVLDADEDLRDYAEEDYNRWLSTGYDD